MTREALYAGLMSGTSLDGVDAVLADFGNRPLRILGAAHRAFSPSLRQRLLALNAPGPDELDRAADLGNELARHYADATIEALAAAGVDAARVRALGCHGQTVRHRPERGYSIQIGNAALLAELCGIEVVADFRSRDVAAGGQGAPLAPAFHAAFFAHPGENRAAVNIGGIANITCLPAGGEPRGFDCGPGNCLLDLWAARHLGAPMDAGGEWGGGGSVLRPLLERLLAEPFFEWRPPKSTGRELFNLQWLEAAGAAGAGEARDVQATLLELSARTIAEACRRYCEGAERVIVCGGGARNVALMRRLEELLAPAQVDSSAGYGVEPELVEAAGFAWLAKQAIEGEAASLPAVTGARGRRVLGAIYPK